MLIHSTSVSLDGYIAGPDGDFTWVRPDEEVHRFHNEQVPGRRPAHRLTLVETRIFGSQVVYLRYRRDR